MDQVNGSFPKDDPLGLAKLGFNTKEEGDAYLESLDLETVDGLKDRATSLRENLANHDSISEKDPVIEFSLLADRQEKELNESTTEDGESSETVSNNSYREKLINGEEEELDGDELESSTEKPPKDDPLGLAKLGYTKEQVDGWLADGYSVADIRSGLAASGNKNVTENQEIIVS